MDKDTITNGLQLFNNYKKAEGEYRQAVKNYMAWYCHNMPKRAVIIHRISNFAVDWILPISAILGFSAGFVAGYYFAIL